MNENTTLFNYGDWVRFNDPMRIFRFCKKPLINEFKWLGLEKAIISIPVYANRVEILQSIDIAAEERGAEIFFINTFGEFIDLPEGLNKGTVFNLEDIERVIILSEEQSAIVKKEIKKYKKEGTTASDYKRRIQESLKMKDIANECFSKFNDTCETFSDYFPQEFAYWYTHISEEELSKKGKELMEHSLQKLNQFDKLIEDKLIEIEKTITLSMTYFEEYNLKSLTPEFIDDKCKELGNLAEKIEKELEIWIKTQDSIEFYKQKDFNLSEKLCMELKRRIGKYISNNASWLKDNAKVVVKTLFCQWMEIKC